MRISQNAANQAIGTVLHETGHGVGVGTQQRYWDTNVHSWYWYGREANKIYHFLENEYTKIDFADGNKVWVGDGTHAWGQNATYDWLINGADKDRHSELQYAGGSALLYGMFIDGLDPTSSNYSVTQHNGIAGYTFNFDDNKKYYIMCKDAERGFGTSLLTNRYRTGVYWQDLLKEKHGELNDSAAWKIEYVPNLGYYRFKNVKKGYYLTHTKNTTNVALNANPALEDTYFQLMPDRTDVTYELNGESITTHGYWFTWTSEDGDFYSMGAKPFQTSTVTYGLTERASFDYSSSSYTQQWIIISEDELERWKEINTPTGIGEVKQGEKESDKSGKYVEDGNVIIYKDGKKYYSSGQEIK